MFSPRRPLQRSRDWFEPIANCRIERTEYARAERGPSCPLWQSTSCRRRRWTGQGQGSLRRHGDGKDRGSNKTEYHLKRAAASEKIRARIRGATPIAEPRIAGHHPVASRRTVFRCCRRRWKASRRRIVCGKAGGAVVRGSGTKTEALGPPGLGDLQSQARLANDAGEAVGFSGEHTASNRGEAIVAGGGVGGGPGGGQFL